MFLKHLHLSRCVSFLTSGSWDFYTFLYTGKLQEFHNLCVVLPVYDVMQIYVVASGSLCEPEQQGQGLFMWRKIVHGCQLRGLSSPPSHLLLSVLYENCCPCQLSQNWPSQFHTGSICPDFVRGTMQANQANQSVHVCSYFSYHCRMKA